LVAAIIGYAAPKQSHVEAASLGVISRALFWILDTYHLSLERSYLSVYNQERVKTDDTPDMDLSVRVSPLAYLGALIRPVAFVVHFPSLYLGLLSEDEFGRSR
jgi:hypothetical protein